jgi:hypothetical protein
MNAHIKAGLSALFIGAGGVAAAQQSGYEFNATISGHTIPVDCDLLQAERSTGADFARQFDIWGHVQNETDLEKIYKHIALHNIRRDQIEAAAQLCRDNF